MSDVRREEFVIYVNKEGREQRYSLIDMAEYWVNHNNQEFWDLYGMNWPFEIGDAQDILNEFQQQLAKERGLPSTSETTSAIKLIDEQIEKAEVILEYTTHSALDESQVLKNNDLALLDEALVALMKRIEIDHPSIVGDWEAPHSQSSLEALKQFQLDKELFEKDPFFQVRKYRFALLSSKSILQEYLKSQFESKSVLPETDHQPWWKSFDSRVAVIGLVLAVLTLALGLFGLTP